MDTKQVRIIFMGTPDIAAVFLKHLIDAKYNVVAIIAQPDRPVGRKKVLTPVPTKVVALENNIPVYQPEKIRLDYEFVKSINPDLIITLAYGQIIPQGLIDIPRLGCINFHGSLLPKYRGAAPMQYALLNNDKETGFSLMEMSKEMDAGKVYAFNIIKIEDEDNYSSLYKKMGDAAIDLAENYLDKYINGELVGISQDSSKVSFAPSIKPEEERIDVNEPIEKVLGKIRALSEVPGAYLFINEDKYKIFKAKIVSFDIEGEVNTVIKADKNGLHIQFKDGILSILELQKVGKNKMDYLSYLNGDHSLLGKIIK